MVRRGLLVALISALLMLIGGGVAAAQCAAPRGNSGGGAAAASVDAGSLPQGFPADLRQFVAGTDEFRAGPWFSGPCAGKGGDLGKYINASFRQEGRLLWWSDPENQATGQEPSHDELPTVFPYDNGEYKMPESACADDLKSWATPSSSNPWGFTWPTAPDPGSVEAMIGASAAASGDVPPQAFSAPCKMDGDTTGMYCAHAFFLDCSKAEYRSDISGCQNWNRSVGTLFGGTAHWIDQNTGLVDRLGDQLSASTMFEAGSWILNSNIAFAKGVANVAGTMVDFANGDGLAAQWANDFKVGAVDMSTKTLQSMACSHSFDPGAPWFLTLYRYSMALGFIVMAFMAVFTVIRSGHKGSPKELAQSLFAYLPMSIFVATFVPGFAALILGVTEAAAEDTAKVLGTSTGEIITNIHLFGGATEANFFGGAIGGLILFFGLACAALMLWVGMQIHQYGMPLSLFVAGISLFMMIHPKYRKKALGPVFVFLGLALSVPLLFLLLAVIFSTANSVWGSEGDTAIGMASQVLFVALGMMLAALAPWALLKWAPILPTKADSEDFGSGGPGVGSEIVGAAGNYMMYSRGGGGGGGGGGGVGGEQPAARSDTTSPTTGVGSATQGQMGPMQSAYQERGDLASAGQHSAKSGGEVAGSRASVHGSGEAAGASRAGGAAASGGTAAAGAATGGIATGVAVAAQAASAAITKAKSTADGSAPSADD